MPVKREIIAHMMYGADVKGQAKHQQYGHMGHMSITNQYDGHTLVTGMMKSFSLR